MNLVDLITPKNEQDGSLDHRFIAISKQLCNLIGDRCTSKLVELYEKSSKIQSDAAGSGLQLVIALFQIDMDERFERSRMKAHIRNQLQELGFKPANVSKLMGAGEFYANNYDKPYNSFEYVPDDELRANQNRFLNTYRKNVTSLYELSRMNDHGIDMVRHAFLTKNEIYLSSKMEDLRREYPRNEHERRGRKPSRANFQETRPTYTLATHESLAVTNEAEDKFLVEEPKSCQRLITEFFSLFSSGDIQSHINNYTPNAQAHLIAEIEAGIPLLQEFVRKNATIDIVSIH